MLSKEIKSNTRFKQLLNVTLYVTLCVLLIFLQACTWDNVSNVGLLSCFIKWKLFTELF